MNNKLEAENLQFEKIHKAIIQRNLKIGLNYNILI